MSLEREPIKLVGFVNDYGEAASFEQPESRSRDGVWDLGVERQGFWLEHQGFRRFV